MRTRIQIRYLALPTMLGLVFVLSGCLGSSGSSDENAPQLNQHIMKFWRLKGAYTGAHNGKNPPNTADLKAWAKSKLSAEELAKMKIDDLDDAFVSPRDHEEYQIAPTPKGRQFGPPRVDVYEKTGVNGKHMVAAMGQATEMDEESLNQLIGKR